MIKTDREMTVTKTINCFKHLDVLCGKILQHYFTWLPDETYVKLLYRFRMGKRLHLENPITFQEKIQWLKLHDRNPRYTQLVDKILVKEYVTKTIGSDYVIPLLGVWEKPEDIDWNNLPNKFVLKTNHSGGNTGVIVCRDKDTFDKKDAIKKLNLSLRTDVYTLFREWQYKNIKKRVFAEAFVETRPEVTDLPDYKWYCFNGEPKFCQVIQDRTTEETIDFFDTEWKHQEFIGLNAKFSNAKFSNAKVQPKRPKDLALQIRIAKKLSKNIPFSRIDLYQTDDKVYFGEITLYPASGIGIFTPDKYSTTLGQLIDMNKVFN